MPTTLPRLARWVLAGPMLRMALAFCLALGLPATALAQEPAAYRELVTLYEEFRAAVVPPLSDGVADYSPAAMARQREQFAALKLRLQALDDNPWPVSLKVDYLLVLAEMNGAEFQHRVVQPWRRDPAFYSTTNLGFGPKMHGAFAAPTLPLADAEQAARLADDLQRVPAVLAQARRNLDDPRGDLVRLGIAQKTIERNVFERVAREVADDYPETAKAARLATEATDAFIAWLTGIVDAVPAHGGVGKDDYNWYLRHVMLFPYDWDEVLAIGEREYQRAMVFLKLEEHRNRGVPEISLLSTLDEFMARQNAADADLIDFLASRAILTVPDYLKPPGEGPYIMPSDRDPARPGLFDEDNTPHFFFQASFRDPRPLRAHNVPGHHFDGQLRQRDTRPIRGQPRLFFVDGIRVEGWAMYLEEMVLQSGFYDDLPRTREINYILQAKRAARVKPELMMHAREWTYAEAMASLTGRTPYWMGPEDAIAQFDIELYLRQPAYGIGYYLGKVELEKLLSDMAQLEGRDFDIKRFHDRFLAAGRMPIALIRWEMTGDESELVRMRALHNL